MKLALVSLNFIFSDCLGLFASGFRIRTFAYSDEILEDFQFPNWPLLIGHKS